MGSRVLEDDGCAGALRLHTRREYRLEIVAKLGF